MHWPRFVFGFLFLGGISFAQVDRGTIVGTISDSKGAVIPAAAVTVTNAGTAQILKLITNDSGGYVAGALRIGTYSVSAEKAGFQKVIQSGVTIDVNQVMRVDLSLPLGTLSEQLTVTAAPALVESETSSLGTIETQQRIVDLPLNGRNFVQLAWLGAGANQGSQDNGPLRGTTDNNRPGIQVAVNGLTSFDNNFLLDGVDNNEKGQGTLAVQPPPDAIQEFRVEENTMAAEFGRGGATVNVVLKSGSNNWHGGAYEFLRNQKLDARNFFDPQRPPFQRNQFGALFGGPIIKNRTFFFVDYEGGRIRQGVSFVSTVPTAKMRGGDFSEAGAMLYDPYTTDPNSAQRQLLNPGNPYTIPASRINPIGQVVVNLFPLPNLPGPFNNFVYTPKQVTDSDQYDARVDHRFSDRDNLFGHSSAQDVRFLKPAPLGIAGGCCQGFGSNIDGLEQNHAAGWMRSFSPTLLNEFRFAFVYWNINTLHLDTGEKRSQQLGIPNANRGDLYSSGLSLFDISGYGHLGDSQYVPELATDHTLQFSDTLSWIRGNHSLKLGGDVKRWNRNFYQAQAPFGRFGFTGLYSSQLTTSSGGSAIADMLLGIPTYSLQDGLTQLDLTNYWEMGLFAQDDWKVNRHLTLNLGLRYEIFSPVGGRVGNFDLQKAIVIDSFGPTAASNAGVQYDLHDFGPRFGFAWAPFSSPKTVIRGAGGIFYAPEGNIFNDLGENPPVLEFYYHQPNPSSIPTASDLISAGFPAQLPGIDPLHPSGQIKTTGPRRLMPRIYEWNFGIQHQLPFQMVADIAYVGTRGTRLWDNESSDLNQAPVPLDSNFGSAPNYGRPYYSVQPDLASILPIDYPRFDMFYNGLQLKLEKRFSNGFTFRGAYTWSKDLGTSQGTPGGAVQNSFDTKLERGYVEPDFRHRFVGSWVYQLPFGRGKSIGQNWNRGADLVLGGWELTGIFVARTGEATTAILSFDPTNTGSFAPWPDRIHDPYDFSFGEDVQATMGCPVGHQSLQCWYNPAAFVIPTLAPGQNFAHQFGNGGSGNLRGPHQVNLDFGLMKDFRIAERNTVSLRAEFFNIANHPQFKLPNTNPDQPGGAAISATLPNNQREIQFGLKWNF
jgi:Carboxypeptidase regulatory-like domain